MILAYDAQLDDLAEPAIRHFLRTQTARRTRILTSIRGAFILGAAFFLFFHNHSPAHAAIAIVLGALTGGLLNYYTYPVGLRRRVRKHFETETRGRLPARTVYTIQNGNLACEILGVTTSFALVDLVAVSEDGQRLELSFGEKGLCLVPLRAFGSEEQKSAWIAALRQANPIPGED